MNEFDLIMCVGGSYYPTAQHFIDEAQRLGVSKRIPAIPTGIGPGTRLWFVHDAFELLERVATRGPGWKREYGKREELQIFGYCNLDHIDIIGEPKFMPVSKLEINIVPLADLKKEVERGCGYRAPGGYYLMATTLITNIHIPLATLGIEKRFLGYRYILRKKIDYILGLQSSTARKTSKK